MYVCVVDVRFRRVAAIGGLNAQEQLAQPVRSKAECSDEIVVQER